MFALLCSIALSPGAMPAAAEPISGETPSLNGLDALRGEFPISLRFRAERYDGDGRRSTPAETRASYATETDGALEKMLHDIGRYGSAGQMELARALPEKLFLEHLLFGSVSKEFAQDFDGPWPFSPAHFAYFVGCRAAAPPAVGDTAVPVADGKLFRKGDLVLLLPVKDGKKLWASSEFAAIDSVEANVLNLKRAVYESKAYDPQRVGCDYVWVAPGALPYTESRKSKTQFMWNWSALCPRDEKGR